MSRTGSASTVSVGIKNSQFGKVEKPVPAAHSVRMSAPPVFITKSQPSMPWSPEVDTVLQIFFFAYFKKLAEQIGEGMPAHSPQQKLFQLGLLLLSSYIRMVMYGCSAFFAVSLECWNLILQQKKENHSVKEIFSFLAYLPVMIHIFGEAFSQEKTCVNTQVSQVVVQGMAAFAAEYIAEKTYGFFFAPKKKASASAGVIRAYQSDMRMRGGL